MTRDEALELLSHHVENESLRKHSLATEAIMRSLASVKGADEEIWGMSGLLHDLDFEQTKEDPSAHGLRTAEMLAPYGLPAEAIDAILRHNAEALNLERKTTFDFALTCAESITGLITAAALVHPDKKVSSLQVKSVQKRMKSKDFARNVNREHVALCERIDIPLVDFIQLSIVAMGSISDQLGL